MTKQAAHGRQRVWNSTCRIAEIRVLANTAKAKEGGLVERSEEYTEEIKKGSAESATRAREALLAAQEKREAKRRCSLSTAKAATPPPVG